MIVMHVERTPDNFEELRDIVEFDTKDGCLFVRFSPTNVVIYAAGQWLTATTSQEDE